MLSLLWDGRTWSARLHWDFLAPQATLERPQLPGISTPPIITRATSLHRRRSNPSRSAAATYGTNYTARHRAAGQTRAAARQPPTAPARPHGIVRQVNPAVAQQTPTAQHRAARAPYHNDAVGHWSQSEPTAPALRTQYEHPVTGVSQSNVSSLVLEKFNTTFGC